MKNFYELHHPLVKHKLSLLRDKNLSKKQFKELIDEITLFIGYEATKHLPLTTKIIKTPLENFEGPCLAGKKPVILAILRAGIGMVDSLLKLMPSARVGHIGLYRDEQSLEPVLYYFKIPANSKDRPFFICDPILATGGSAIEAIHQLKKRGISSISFVCIVAAPEGVKNLHKHHPDITIYAANLDRTLNKQGYILPGLGDAGNRMFGTK